ncbi:MAG: hypothetical protein ABIR36_17230 [Nitrospiraceae bacterium]
MAVRTHSKAQGKRKTVPMGTVTPETSTRRPAPISPSEIRPPMLKAGEDHLRKCQEECLSILRNDQINPHWDLYKLALLSSLGVTDHPFQLFFERYLAMLPLSLRATLTLPKPEEEPHYLRILGEHVMDSSPDLVHVFETSPNVLRIYTASVLGCEATDEHSREVLRHAAGTTPPHIQRPWRNPVRFSTNSKTGEVVGYGPMPKVSNKQFIEANELFKALTTLPRKEGRPKKSAKPPTSGKKPPPHSTQLYEAAWAMKQRTPPYHSPAWPVLFAREQGLPIPKDLKGQHALFSRVREWAIKGKLLALTKVQV